MESKQEGITCETIFRTLGLPVVLIIEAINNAANCVFDHLEVLRETQSVLQCSTEYIEKSTGKVIVVEPADCDNLLFRLNCVIPSMTEPVSDSCNYTRLCLLEQLMRLKVAILAHQRWAIERRASGIIEQVDTSSDHKSATIYDTATELFRNFSLSLAASVRPAVINAAIVVPLSGPMSVSADESHRKQAQPSANSNNDAYVAQQQREELKQQSGSGSGGDAIHTTATAAKARAFATGGTASSSVSGGAEKKPRVDQSTEYYTKVVHDTNAAIERAEEAMKTSSHLFDGHVTSVSPGAGEPLPPLPATEGLRPQDRPPTPAPPATATDTAGGRGLSANDIITHKAGDVFVPGGADTSAEVIAQLKEESLSHKKSIGKPLKYHAA